MKGQLLHQLGLPAALHLSHRKGKTPGIFSPAKCFSVHPPPASSTHSAGCPPPALLAFLLPSKHTGPSSGLCIHSSCFWALSSMWALAHVLPPACVQMSLLGDTICNQTTPPPLVFSSPLPPCFVLLCVVHYRLPLWLLPVTHQWHLCSMKAGTCLSIAGPMGQSGCLLTQELSRICGVDERREPRVGGRHAAVRKTQIPKLTVHVFPAALRVRESWSCITHRAERLSIVCFFLKGSQSQAEVGRTSFRVQTSQGSNYSTTEKAKDKCF